MGIYGSSRPKERRNFTKQGTIRENKNYIIAEIYISEEDITKKIRIINSYEQVCRESGYIKENYKNETEIKYNCKITINDIVIPFSYFYKFKVSGKYIIKYSFEHYVTNADFMFYKCSSLTNLNLSNFNTQNVTNMDFMFDGCSSLIKKLLI